MSKSLEEVKREIREKAEFEITELERLAVLAAKHGLSLTPDATVQVVEPDPQLGRVRRHQKGWNTTMLEHLNEAPHGMTRVELKKSLHETHLGPRLKETEAAFYGGIQKLMDRDKVTEYKGRLFLPFLFRRFEQDLAAGRIEDFKALPASGYRSPSRDLVLDLAKAKGSVTSKDVMEMLERELKGTSYEMKNSHSVYNLLSRMVKKSELMREDNLYSLPLNENGEAEASPETDQDDTPDQNPNSAQRGA